MLTHRHSVTWNKAGTTEGSPKGKDSTTDYHIRYQDIKHFDQFLRIPVHLTITGRPTICVLAGNIVLDYVIHGSVRNSVKIYLNYILAMPVQIRNWTKV